jgi:RimJ/RimL family protein N-acetyltransferase
MRYAFMELGLNRLDGDMIRYNERSIKFYIEKGGWKHEGVQRNWHFRNGQYHDKIIVGVTREDYLAKIAETNYWNT